MAFSSTSPYQAGMIPNGYQGNMSIPTTNTMNSSAMPQHSMPMQSTQMPQQMQQPMAMATGGHATHDNDDEDGDMDMAHFNKDELDDLDALQGGKMHLPGTRIRHYGPLEHALAHNSEVQKAMGDHINAYMKGGQIHHVRAMAKHMKANGRHGDKEVAFIGPRTREMFRHLAGGESINPQDGQPEYFSFGGLFSGLKNVAARAATHAGNVAGKVATHAGNAYKKAAPIMQNMATKASQFASSPHGQNLLNAGLTAGMGALGGQNAKDALLSGANSFASNYDNAAGRFVQGATSPEGGNLQERALRGVNQAASPVDTKLGRFAEGVSNPNMPGNVQQRLAHGIARASEGSSSPIAIAAREGARGIAQGQGGRRAARRAAGAGMTAANPALLNQAYGPDSFDPSLYQ